MPWDPKQRIEIEPKHKLAMTLLGWVCAVILVGFALFMGFAAIGFVISYPLDALRLLIGIGLYWLGYCVGKTKAKT